MSTSLYFHPSTCLIGDIRGGRFDSDDVHHYTIEQALKKLRIPLAGVGSLGGSLVAHRQSSVVAMEARKH